MTPANEQAIILITGIQAAGKSTIAQLLAERLPRSVHVRGDLFRRMVVNGRADMTPDPSQEALRQLRLRHRLAAPASDTYFQDGFTVVLQDVVLGEHLTDMIELIQQRPLLIVVLAPRPEVIQAREAARAKTPTPAGPSTCSTTSCATRHPDWGSGSIPPTTPQPTPSTRSSPAHGPRPRSRDQAGIQTLPISDCAVTRQLRLHEHHAARRAHPGTGPATRAGGVMAPKLDYRWHLRTVMATRGMFSTTDLAPLLAERGIHLSSSQVYRLVAERPERLSLKATAGPHRRPRQPLSGPGGLRGRPGRRAAGGDCRCGRPARARPGRRGGR